MLHCYMLHQYKKGNDYSTGVKVFFHALKQLLLSSMRLSCQITFFGKFHIALLHAESVFQGKAFDARLKDF